LKCLWHRSQTNESQKQLVSLSGVPPLYTLQKWDRYWDVISSYLKFKVWLQVKRKLLPKSYCLCQVKNKTQKFKCLTSLTQSSLQLATNSVESSSLQLTKVCSKSSPL
jgi:hypothetical protein